MRARVVAMLLALVVLAGLGAPAATAAPHDAAAAPVMPAAAPAAPGTEPAARGDIWGKMCMAGVLIPAAGVIGCGKKLVEHGGPKGAAKAAAKSLGEGVIGDFAKATAAFVGDLIKKGLTWWLTTDSVQVKDSGVMEPTDPKDPSKSLSLHAIMLGIGTAIAVFLWLFAGIRTMIQRRGQPIAQAVQGLVLDLFVIAVGVGVIDSLLVGSDALTKQILKVGFDGDAPEKVAAMLLPQIGNPAALLLIAVITLLISVVQVVLLFLRQAAVPVLALLLPIAGAGQMGGDGPRKWLPNLINMLMAIICYKPAAALIMTIGFVEIENGDKIIDWMRGVVTLVLSVVALKGLLSLFAPIGVAVGNASAAGGGIAGGLMGMASMAGGPSGGPPPGGPPGGGPDSGGGTGGPGGTSAVDHSRQMEKDGPNSSSSPDENDTTAVKQADSVPGQRASESGAETPAASGATAGADGAAGASSSASGTAVGGPASIAIVAAEAAKGAADKGGNTMGGEERK